jgi:TP901 family phage tail tape measure protein
MFGKYSVSAIFGAKDLWSKTVDKMSGRFSKFTQKVERSTRQLNSAASGVFSAFKTVGVAAAAGATALGFLGKSIVDTGADFEAAITGVGSVALLTREQIKPLEDQAKRLGATTKFTATQAAEGMEILMRAGFGVEGTMAAIDGVLSAAAASGLEMSEVADVVSSSLKGMGLEYSNAGRVADVLALASSKTKSSIGSLGESMKNLAPVARQMGVEFEEAVAAVALLQDTGLDASEAGTATATMLTKLAKPAGSVAAQMKKFGIAFKDANGNAKSLPAILGEFDKAAKKSGGNMDVVAFFADLVGLRGQKAALGLKEMFASGKLSTLVADLKGAEGSAAKMAKLKMDNLRGDWELFGSAVDALKTQLFELESGPLRGVVKTATDWVSANKDLITSGAQEFMTGIRDSLPTIVKWLERAGKAAGVILGVAVAIKIWAGAMALLNAAMLANPVTLWIVGITLAVAALVAFWPEISAFFQRIGAAVADVATRVADKIKSFVVAASGPIKAFLTGVKDFAIGIIKLMFFPLWPVLSLVKMGFAALSAFIRENWGPITAFFSGIWETVSGAFVVAWDFVLEAAGFYADLFMSAWEPLKSFFAGLWDTIKSGFDFVFGPIISGLGFVIDKVQQIGRSDLFSLGGDEPADASGADGAPASSTQPKRQVVTTAGAVTREVRESTSTTRNVLDINAPPGIAKFRDPKGASKAGLTMQPSGAF